MSVALGMVAALAITLSAAPAQARIFIGFGFGYPFYRPFPVFYRPYLPPPPVYVVPRPVYYAPTAGRVSRDGDLLRLSVALHRHRRTVSHRVCTCE